MQQIGIAALSFDDLNKEEKNELAQGRGLQEIEDDYNRRAMATRNQQMELASEMSRTQGAAKPAAATAASIGQSFLQGIPNSQPALFAPSILRPPPAAGEPGGFNALVLDWTPPATSVEIAGYNLYRREFGQTGDASWGNARNIGNTLRFIEADDPSKIYQYKIKAYDSAHLEIDQKIDLVLSANYNAPEQGGLLPENVLVLINESQEGLGMVNLTQEVDGQNLSEGNLLSFLGLQREESAAYDQWYVEKTAQGIKVPLGVYYAIRRNIPKQNVIFLKDIPNDERWEQNRINNIVKFEDEKAGKSSGILVPGLIDQNTMRLWVDHSSWSLEYRLVKSGDGDRENNAYLHVDSGEKGKPLGVTQYVVKDCDIAESCSERSISYEEFENTYKPGQQEGFVKVESKNYRLGVQEEDKEKQVRVATKVIVYKKKLPNFDASVVDPIVRHLQQKGIGSKITSIVSAYHFPINATHIREESMAGPYASWDDYLSWSLSKRFGMENTSMDPGRRFSRKLGDQGYLTTRLDGPTLASVKKMIDDSLWAELHPIFNTSDRAAYVDWRGPSRIGLNPNDSQNQLFIQAADIIGRSGLFGANWQLPARQTLTPDFQFSNSILTVAPDINDPTAATASGDLNHQMNNTFLYTGWYDEAHHFIDKLFSFARGGIGLHYDSYSAASLRDMGLGNPMGGNNEWGAGMLRAGAAATIGSMDEPMLGGHADPDLLVYYLLQGYTFAEAAHAADPRGSQNHFKTVANGDPLYRPFPVSPAKTIANTIIDLQNPTTQEKIGERHISKQSLRNNILAYRDYDLQNRLVAQRLENGLTFYYHSDGRTAVYGLEDQSDFVQNNSYMSSAMKLLIYDAAGQLTAHRVIPAGSNDFDRDEIVSVQNGFEIHRHYKGGRAKDVFDASGFLMNFTTDSGQLIPLAVAGGPQNGAVTTYRALGRVTQKQISVGGKSLSVTDIIEDLTNGGRLEFTHDPGNGRMTEAVYYDKNRRPVAFVSQNNSPGSFSVDYQDGGVNFTLANVNASPAELFQIMLILPSYAKQMNDHRESLVNYLMIQEKIPQSGRDALLAQIPLILNAVVHAPQDLSYTLTRNKSGSVALKTLGSPSSRGETFRFKSTLYLMQADLPYSARNALQKEFGLFYFKGAVTQVPGGRYILFDETLRPAYEIAVDGTVQKNIYVSATGNFIGRIQITADGEKSCLDTSGNPVNRLGVDIINGKNVIFVGYPDKGVPSLADAMAMVESGDVIQLADGRYPAAPLQISNGKRFEIRGNSDASKVVIEGNNQSFLTIDSPNDNVVTDITLSGITFQNFRATSIFSVEFGAAVHLDNVVFRNNTLTNSIFNVSESTLTIRNSRFEDNSSANNGVAISAGTGSHVFAINSVFKKNVSGQGGALFVDDSELELVNTTMEGNTATTGGGAIYSNGSTLSIRNSLIHGNSAASGSAIQLNGTSAASLQNVTLTQNNTGNGVIDIGDARSSMTITKSIIYGNAALDIRSSSGTAPSVTQSLLQMTRAGVGNITGDPKFVDPAHGNYTIAADSPARSVNDAGWSWGYNVVPGQITSKPTPNAPSTPPTPATATPTDPAPKQKEPPPGTKIEILPVPNSYRSVTLKFTAPDNVVSMQGSWDHENWGESVLYTAGSEITIPNVPWTKGGLYKFYVRYTDAQRNVFEVESEPFEFRVPANTVKPTGALSIEPAAGGKVTLVFNAQDDTTPTPAVRMRGKWKEEDAWGDPPVTFMDRYTVLPPWKSEGNHKFFVQYIDENGNLSDTYEATIYYRPPTLTMQLTALLDRNTLSPPDYQKLQQKGIRPAPSQAAPQNLTEGLRLVQENDAELYNRITSSNGIRHVVITDSANPDSIIALKDIDNSIALSLDYIKNHPDPRDLAILLARKGDQLVENADTSTPEKQIQEETRARMATLQLARKLYGDTHEAYLNLLFETRQSESDTAKNGLISKLIVNDSSAAQQIQDSLKTVPGLSLTHFYKWMREFTVNLEKQNKQPLFLSIIPGSAPGNFNMAYRLPEGTFTLVVNRDGKVISDSRIN